MIKMNGMKFVSNKNKSDAVDVGNFDTGFKYLLTSGEDGKYVLTNDRGVLGTILTDTILEANDKALELVSGNFQNVPSWWQPTKDCLEFYNILN